MTLTLKKVTNNLAFASALLVSSIGSMQIIAIVAQCTGWTMPTWLAWVLIGVASVSLVVALISTVGGVVIAPWLAYTIIAADSVSL